jgi:hypothetical protein
MNINGFDPYRLLIPVGNQQAFEITFARLTSEMKTTDRLVSVVLYKQALAMIPNPRFEGLEWAAGFPSHSCEDIARA